VSADVKMNPMRSPLRGFWLTLVITWIVLAAAGIVYARLLDAPVRIVAPVIAAFLWEGSFYLVPGFASVREAMEKRRSRPVLAFGMIASAATPYCAYTIPLGLFDWHSLALILSLVAAASFCYLCLPHNGYTDAVFLVFMAGAVLSGSFSAVYPVPAPRVRLDILGQMMWVRTGVLAMLWFRRIEGIRFGFIPSWNEWRIGFVNYAFFLPVGLPLSLGLGFVRFRLLPRDWWVVAGLALVTFLGMLWVVALAEEFFFRGVLQQMVSNRLGPVAGLILASILFGLVHLPFRSFPNWKFAVVAGVAGLFYGRAYWQAGGIRAAMITHALVNTTTRIFFA
jgi:uncharacterized protein